MQRNKVTLRLAVAVGVACLLYNAFSVSNGKDSNAERKQRKSTANQKQATTLPEPVPPYIYTCTSGCVQGSFWPQPMSSQTPSCLGDYETNGGPARPWTSSPLDDASNVTTTYIDNDVLAVYSSVDNINHALHDDLWAALLWSSFSSSSALSNVTVLMQSNNAWTAAVLQVARRAFDWQVYLPSDATKRICVRNHQQHHVYLNGHIRNIQKYQPDRIVPIRQTLRQAATTSLLSFNKSSSLDPREKVVIYTRQDSAWRQLQQVNNVLDVIDQRQFQVTILENMPKNFAAQVEIFAQADLFLAPNGGWAPNVLWMKDTACVVELHLYKTDSWIEMFGLKLLFRKDAFLTVTGDYKDPNLPRVDRPKRNGGDDAILGSRVSADIRQVLGESASCRRFLNIRRLSVL